MQEYQVLNVKVQAIREHLLKELLFNFLTSDSQHQIATVNPEFIIRAQKDKKFRDILNETSLATIDGTGIIWALQMLGHKISLDQRLTGVRLTDIILQLAQQKDLKIMFCLRPDGLTSPDKFFMIVKERYPQLNFQVSDISTAVFKTQCFQPEILLMGLGAPDQEYWIAENLPKMPSVKIAAGVGGAFDFLSGKIKRAPKILQSFGLEWSWRLLLQPNRILRMYQSIVVFPYMIITRKGRSKQNKAKK